MDPSLDPPTQILGVMAYLPCLQLRQFLLVFVRSLEWHDVVAAGVTKHEYGGCER